MSKSTRVKCELCDKSYRSKSDLKKHVERFHQKIKRFFCDRCDYACYTNVAIKKHLKIHVKRDEFDAKKDSLIVEHQLTQITDHPDYYINKKGEVYSFKHHKCRKMVACLGKDNYCRINLDGKQVMLHRLLAIAFIENPDNKPHIDHINRNQLDNRLENLRWVTRSENMRNMSVSCNNTSGFQGISLRKVKKENWGDRWVADWVDENGKHRTKSFSIKKYGDKAKELAIAHRAKMVKKYYPTKTIFD